MDMDREKLRQNMEYLVEKYTDGRDDLVELFRQNPHCAKYVLAEIDKEKKGPYEEKDLDMVQEIAYYYI